MAAAIDLMIKDVANSTGLPQSMLGYASRNENIPLLNEADCLDVKDVDISYSELRLIDSIAFFYISPFVVDSSAAKLVVKLCPVKLKVVIDTPNFYKLIKCEGVIDGGLSDWFNSSYEAQKVLSVVRCNRWRFGDQVASEVNAGLVDALMVEREKGVDSLMTCIVNRYLGLKGS